MAFPLIVRTARISFEAVDPQLERIGRSLGYAPWQCFYKITLPLAARGLFAAAILGFTRAMGEFGASIMIAGNIPDAPKPLPPPSTVPSKVVTRRTQRICCCWLVYWFYRRL